MNVYIENYLGCIYVRKKKMCVLYSRRKSKCCMGVLILYL